MKYDCNIDPPQHRNIYSKMATELLSLLSLFATGEIYRYMVEITG